MVGRAGSMGQSGFEIYFNCGSWSLSLVAQNSSLQLFDYPSLKCMSPYTV